MTPLRSRPRHCVSSTGAACSRSERAARLASSSSTKDLPPRAQLVAEALRRARIPGPIRLLESAAPTAAAAAAALGCEVGAIANSLIFTATTDTGTEPVLLLTSGAHRVDVEATAQRIGVRSLGRATAPAVREATGQAIGGVAPTGHPAPVRTWVDEALAAYPEIWAAGGTPDTVFPATYQQLLALAGGRAVRVA